MGEVGERQLKKRQIKHRVSESELTQKESEMDEVKTKHILERIAKFKGQFSKDSTKSKLTLFLSKGNLIQKNLWKIKKSKSLNDLKYKEVPRIKSEENMNEKEEFRIGNIENMEGKKENSPPIGETVDEERTANLSNPTTENDLTALKKRLLTINNQAVFQKDFPKTSGIKKPKLKTYKRRSSLEKIREIPSYICTQSFIAFPNACLWLKEFLTVLSRESRKLIPTVKILFLTLAIYLGIFMLFVQLSACLFSIITLSTPPGLVFLVSCILYIGIMTIRVILLENKHGTASVK